PASSAFCLEHRLHRHLTHPTNATYPTHATHSTHPTYPTYSTYLTHATHPTHPTQLERNAGAQLNLAHVLRAPDLPECRRGREVQPWIAQVHGVEDVRRLETELKHGASLETDIAEEAQVRVAIPGAIDDVAPGVAVRSKRRLGECGDVEPAFDQDITGLTVVDAGVTDQIGAIVRDAVEVAILARGDGEGGPALQDDDRRDRPVARKHTERRRRVLEVVDLPYAREGEHVPAIGRRPGSFIGEPRRALDSRQAAALEIDIVVAPAEGVVSLGGQVRAAALGAQLEALVVAAEDGRKHGRGADRAGQIWASRVDVRRSRPRPEDGIVVVDARREMPGVRHDVRGAHAEAAANLSL